LKILTIVAISAWLGTMGFLSLAVAPAVFRELPRESAAALMSALFPRYYWVGVALGSVALLGVGWRWGGTGPITWADRSALGLAVVMLGLTLYALFGLLPEVERARAQLAAARTGAASIPVADAQAAFGRLHRFSGLANMLAMAAGLSLLVLEVTRRAR
jgi:uncharacterized membrane protein